MNGMTSIVSISKPRLGGYRTGLLGQQLFQPVGNLADQDFAPVFGTPDQVVADIVDRFVAGCPALICHTQKYRKLLFFWQLNTMQMQIAPIHPTSKLDGLSRRVDRKSMIHKRRR
jgi:hypothetical protein